MGAEQRQRVRKEAPHPSGESHCSRHKGRGEVMRSAVALSIFLWIAAPLMSAQVRVWEGTLPLTTTDEGAPDENPPFDVFSNKQNYPYTIRDNVRETETVQAWRAIYLENEYLKCSILPDLGGHIYTCVDKVNGRPMFYANPSIKKALIGYRGAWSAFGVEFDFPVSHNWVTLSPVDWAYASAADGSASVTVGNRDRVDGMEWTVEIVLRPGSTVLEVFSRMTSFTDCLRRSFTLLPFGLSGGFWRWRGGRWTFLSNGFCLWWR